MRASRKWRGRRIWHHQLRTIPSSSVLSILSVVVLVRWIGFKKKRKKKEKEKGQERI